jgi:hypothetical protein
MTHLPNEHYSRDATNISAKRAVASPAARPSRQSREPTGILSQLIRFCGMDGQRRFLYGIGRSGMSDSTEKRRLLPAGCCA